MNKDTFEDMIHSASAYPRLQAREEVKSSVFAICVILYALFFSTLAKEQY